MKPVTRRLILSSLALGGFTLLAFGSAGDPTPGPDVKLVNPPSQMTVGEPVTLTVEVSNPNDKVISLENLSLDEAFVDRMEFVSMSPERTGIEEDTFGRGEEWTFSPISLDAKTGSATITLEFIPRVGMDQDDLRIAVESRIDGSVGSGAAEFDTTIAGEPRAFLVAEVRSPEVVTAADNGLATIKITNNGVRPRRVTRFKFTKGYGKKTYVEADFDVEKDKMKRSEAFVFKADIEVEPQQTKSFDFEIAHYESGTADGHVEITYDGGLMYDDRLPIQTRIE